MNTTEKFEAGLDAIDKLFAAGNTVDALALTDHLLASEPPPPVAAALHRRRARAYTFQGNWEQAALEWTRVLAQFPDDSEAREGTVHRCDAAGLSPARRAAWERVTAVPFAAPTSDNRNWTLRGYCCCIKDVNGRNIACKDGRANPACSKAEELCTSAIARDPADPLAYCTRAGVHQCRGNWEAALADCSRAVELDPGCLAAYSLRASVCNRNGRLEEAIADWTRVIELNPSDAVAYKLRGFAYEELGEEDKAAEDHARAFELERTKPE